MFYFPQTDQVLLVLVPVGIATGLPAGLYVSLAAQSLRPRERAIGMGLFYTIYYILFSISPLVAGKLIDLRGSTDVAFSYSAALLVITLASAMAGQSLRRRV